MLGETEKADLTLRFEVLWSRLPIMLDSEETTEARAIDGAVAMLRGFFDTLAAVEREVTLLQRGDRERYRQIRSPRCSSVTRSEEHTSELQSLMRISYAVFCLKKKTQKNTNIQSPQSHTSNKQYQ